MKIAVCNILLVLFIVLLNCTCFIFANYQSMLLFELIGVFIGIPSLIYYLWYGTRQKKRRYVDGDLFLWQAKLILGVSAVIYALIAPKLENGFISISMLVFLLLILNTGCFAILTCKSSSIIPPIVIILLCWFISKYSMIASFISMFIAIFYFWCIFMINIDTRVSFFRFFSRRSKKTFNINKLPLKESSIKFQDFWRDYKDRIMAVSIDFPQNMCILYRMDDSEKFIDCSLSDGEIYSVINPVNLGKIYFFKYACLNNDSQIDNAQSIMNLAESILSTDSNFIRCNSIGLKKFVGYKRIEK